jgi:hypothetical protein
MAAAAITHDFANTANVVDRALRAERRRGGTTLNRTRLREVGVRNSTPV